MRIVLVNNYLFLKGGAERVFLDQADLFRRKGHEVFLFSQKDPANFQDPSEKWFPPGDGLRSKGLAAGPLGVLRFIYNRANREAFRGFLREVRPDLIHAHNLYGGLTTAVLDAAADEGIPWVLTLHDYKLISPSPNLMSREEPCRDCLVNPGTFRCVLRKCHRGSFATTTVYYSETWFNRHFRKYGSAAALIAPSSFMARKVIEAGWEKERVHVVPNALDPAFFEPSTGRGTYFLFAGRLSDEKGVAFLLESWKGVKGELVLAGEGESLDRYKKMTEGLSGVRFVGKKDPAQMKELFRNCMAVVVPSLWHENASMTVLEAMAHGKPVVATRMGGLPEQVQDGVNGFLVEPGDRTALVAALTQLTSEVGLVETLGKNARRIFEKQFDNEGYYSALLKVYENITVYCQNKPRFDFGLAGGKK